MLRHGLAIVAVASIMGCQAGIGTRGVTDEQRSQAVAYAATAQYPQDVEVEELRMTAVVNQRANTVTILNPTNEAVRNVDVWVNGTYVQQVRAIPPNGSVELNRAEFYDAGGRSFGDVTSAVTRVQLQTGEQELYNLLGPVFQQ